MQPTASTPQVAPVLPTNQQQTNSEAPDSQGPNLTPAFSLFGSSFKAWKVNLGSIILMSLIVVIPIIGLVMLVVTQAVNRAAFDSHGETVTSSSLNAFSIIIGLICLIALIFLSVVSIAGMTKLQIASARGEKLSFKPAFRTGMKLWGRSIGLFLLVGVIVVVGLLLLIIPGIFMIKRYYLSMYYLVDKDYGIRQAMDSSVEASKHGVWGVLGVQLLISLAGIVPLVGGIINIVGSIGYYFAPAIRYTEIDRILSATASPTATAPNSMLPTAATPVV